MNKLRLILDTYARNFRMAHWPPAVLEPLEEAFIVVDDFQRQVAVIATNKHLTPEGKIAARKEAATAAIAAIQKWHQPKLAGIDTEIGVHRAALVPKPVKVDSGRIDFVLRQLQPLTSQEIATLYGSASDEERAVLEAASASVGRVPRKTSNGLVWTPLLDPESVDEHAMARARAANPAGVAKLEELREIRGMHVSVAGIATAEVERALTEGVVPA